jgi:hypothetical protein
MGWKEGGHGRVPRGVKNLSKAKDKKPPHNPGGGGKRPPGDEYVKVLRSVYDDTLNEEIPPAMLDLLGKLD